MKNLLLVLSLIVLVAGNAMAYPGPNSMGIYMDDEATGPVATCYDADAFDTLTLYLVVSGFDQTQIVAWEAQVENVNTDGNMFGSWALVVGVNVGSGNDYIVGCADSPILPNDQDVAVLMTMDVVVMNADAEMEFYVRRVPGSLSFPDTPGYAYDLGFFVPTYTSTGGPDTPCFVINPSGDCYTANEDATWGAVKTLYR